MNLKANFLLKKITLLDNKNELKILMSFWRRNKELMPHQCDFGALNAHFIPVSSLVIFIPQPHSSSYPTLCFIELLNICRSGDIYVCEIVYYKAYYFLSLLAAWL